MLPPPPPPLLPVRHSRRSKPAISAPLLFNARNDVVADESPESRVDAFERAEKNDEPFQPCHMFFYGSLMDPEVIQAVLGLPEIPIVSPATLSGFTVRMWGIYPALVADRPGQVTGCIWEVNDEDHFNSLAAYETEAYTWVRCEARLDDGSILEHCRTFCWAGSPGSKELEDGAFDFERYQKYFKSSVVRHK
jgi:gamma-glutamylcyclotransferase (GGCT)/AIG2-like uncharacterized protein YtfP